ncbi:hypothetical protein AMECASPLE_031517 [Ameca splendens]|uniref:Uncharacterized protein n=1 Tax=Ameca splendens TaxID=208324 RepID=A0ABV0YTC6_9TELE
MPSPHSLPVFRLSSRCSLLVSSVTLIHANDLFLSHLVHVLPCSPFELLVPFVSSYCFNSPLCLHVAFTWVQLQTDVVDSGEKSAISPVIWIYRRGSTVSSIPQLLFG